MVEVANGRSLVWGAEAVQALRERLGVGGRTVGALPRGPRQNSRLGLPLLLLPEEARLLAEIGAVTLVSAPRPDPRNHGLVRNERPVYWEGLGGPVLERGSWKVVNRVRIPAFLRDCRLCLGIPAKFTSQALASFKRQQEQSFQDQSTLAAEAREIGVRNF